MSRNRITRIYVRHYRDNGQTTAYVDWSNGSCTEGSLKRFCHPHYCLMFTFGAHMHALFRAGKRAGLRLEREVW